MSSATCVETCDLDCGPIVNGMHIAYAPSNKNKARYYLLLFRLQFARNYLSSTRQGRICGLTRVMRLGRRRDESDLDTQAALAIILLRIVVRG